MVSQLSELTQVIDLFQRDKLNAKKQFNPNDEPIWILKVIEKRNMKRLRPWIGAWRIDKEKTAEYGSKQYERVPPSPQTITLSEKDRQTSGRHDTINYIDPDMIDSETELPLWRTFIKGEVFLAVDTNAAWMTNQDFALAMPKFRNNRDETTEKLPFEWADEGEILSDEKGILIKKYHGRYSTGRQTVLGLAQQMVLMQKKIEELESSLRK